MFRSIIQPCVRCSHDLIAHLTGDKNTSKLTVGHCFAKDCECLKFAEDNLTYIEQEAGKLKGE